MSACSPPPLMLVSSLRAAARHCIRQPEGGVSAGPALRGPSTWGVGRDCEGSRLGPGTHLQIWKRRLPFSWLASFPGPLGRCSRGHWGKHCPQMPFRGKEMQTITWRCENQQWGHTCDGKRRRKLCVNGLWGKRFPKRQMLTSAGKTC